MSRHPLKSIALACLAAGSISAHADNVTFAGQANGAHTVNIALSAPNTPVSLTAAAGGFTTSMNGGPSFTTYCIDLYQYIAYGSALSDYAMVSGSAHVFANSHAATDIGKLYSEHNVVNDATTQAAFQIAVWEIAYETTGSYNLASGSAMFSGGTAASSGSLALASTWLGGLSGVTNIYNVKVLESAGHQDQVFATAAVPEPSTYALMAGGLLAIGFLARRRAARGG